MQLSNFQNYKKDLLLMTYNDFESFFNEKERCNTTLNYIGTRTAIVEHLKNMCAKSPNVVENVLN